MREDEEEPKGGSGEGTRGYKGRERRGIRVRERRDGAVERSAAGGGGERGTRERDGTSLG